MIIVDFETRSRVNLITHGAYNYAYDPSTNALCCAFIDVDSDWEYLWMRGETLPKAVRKRVERADLIAAHNAQFDRLIWRNVAIPQEGFPEVEFDRWYCTSAQCRVNGLPASLDDAGRALDAQHRKSGAGTRLIKLLSIPQPDGTFNEDPALMAEMGEYCLQDARTAKAIFLATRRLSQREHDDWLNNEDINERGVMIDIALANAAQRYANDEYIQIADLLDRESGGVITKHTQAVRAARWVVDQLPKDHPALNIVGVWRGGELKYTLDKGAREELLDGDECGNFTLPDAVYNVVTLLDEGSQSSVMKFKNMSERADPITQRLYGAFIYAGASATLRFSSRGLQMHNLPQRDGFKTLKEAEDTYRLIMSGQDLHSAVMPTLKNMLRYAIRAQPGHTLIVGDWAGIEARVLPWLTDSKGGYKKLELIASGVDIYTVTAKAIGHPTRRDLGKVMELACGYQGSKGAFKQFARAYGIEALPDSEIIDLVTMWRANNQWAVDFWHGLQAAAEAAVGAPGKVFRVGRIGFYFSKELMGGSLLMILPDETILTYPKARLEYVDGEYRLTALKASVKMSADAKEWPREQLYGGKLAGHATQGTAAGLLRDLISRVNCIAHVHDEVILEVEKARAVRACAQLKYEMETPPEWADRLPLKADPILTERYRK